MIDNVGSVSFNLAYLAVIWCALLVVLAKAPREKSPEWKAVFYAFLALGVGDFFHLVTRTAVFFAAQSDGTGVYDLDSTVWLIGFGLICTSVTVQVFYVGLYYYWRAGEARRLEKGGREKPAEAFFKLDIVVISSTIFRFVLLAYPQNQFGVQATGLNWFRILTNVPLFVIGILVVVLFLRRANVEESAELPGFSERDRSMVKNSAVWILVSYACYSLTIFLSWWNPLFGMAMIPKTLAYLAVLYYFFGGLLVQKKA
ncbi:MAG: hypothetical protein ACTSU5_22265 [Promethearchaeota archaeon]